MDILAETTDRCGKRCGVAIIHDLNELPSCHMWKNIPNTNDYENEYGWIAELVEKNNENA